MSSYLFQLLIWAGLAYLLGCILGCWFRKMGADADVPPPVTKTVTPPPPPKKPEVPVVAKAAIPAAAAIATAAVVKEVVKPKAPPPPPPPRPVAPPPPPPRPVVAKVEPAKVITREMHTKADPLPTVRAATTTLPNHLTRKAEEIHHDKNIRHVDGGADRVLEKRVGTTTRVTETRAAETRPVAVAETRRVVAEPVRVAPTPAPVRAAEPVRTVAPAPVTTTVEVGGMSRPKGIASARGNRPDDLQRISGVGPKNEKILQKLGFYHFDQIAAWSESEASWVDDHLKFGGRVRRENWIHQASLLASGKEAEFLKQYGTGGLKNSSGDKVSGSKTRK
jgi:predicted flap endonuclease-1-like 5' DNA nuclease